MSNKCVFLSTLLIFTFAMAGAHAGVVRLVKNNRVIFRISGESVRVGQIMNVRDSRGRLVGRIKVIKKLRKLAMGKIIVGGARKGYQVSGRQAPKRRREEPQEDSLDDTFEDDDEDNEDDYEDKEDDYEDDEGRTSTRRSSQENDSSYFMNLRTNVGGDISGFLNGTILFNTGENWAIGASFQSISYDEDPDLIVEGSSFALKLKKYFSGTFSQGWVFSTQLGLVNVDFKSKVPGLIAVTSSGVILDAIAGYEFYWDSFNVSLGIGVVYYDLESTVSVVGLQDLDTPLSGLNPAVDISIGFAF